MNGRIACLIALCLAAGASTASAAPTSFPDTWVNGGPYSLEGLKGKVAVLVYYEET